MRVKLEGGEVLKAGDLVNGVVVGIWGREVTGGKFSVADVIFAKIGAGEGSVTEEDISVCVLSGLELGGECSGWLDAAQLATDWVVGSVGGPGEQADIARVEAGEGSVTEEDISVCVLSGLELGGECSG